MNRESPNLDSVVLETGLISSPAMQFEKMKWNRWRATHLLEGSRQPEDYIFALNDYAISALALRDWFKSDVTRLHRKGQFQSRLLILPVAAHTRDKRAIERYIIDYINQNVPFQEHFEVMANTSKHGAPNTIDGKPVRFRLRPWGSDLPEAIADEFANTLIAAPDSLSRRAIMSQIPKGAFWHVGVSPAEANGEVPLKSVIWSHWASWRGILLSCGYVV